MKTQLIPLVSSIFGQLFNEWCFFAEIGAQSSFLRTWMSSFIVGIIVPHNTALFLLFVPLFYFCKAIFTEFALKETEWNFATRTKTWNYRIFILWKTLQILNKQSHSAAKYYCVTKKLYTIFFALFIMFRLPYKSSPSLPHWFMYSYKQIVGAVT